MANKQIIGTTTSSFQYRLESDIDKKLGQAEENLLQFETQFKKGDLTYKELEMIARNLESAAYFFGEQYGLGGTRLLSHTSAKVNHYKDSIEFKNDAMDDYDRFYAGFVEYGHRTKKGYFPARPFMRNALYTVAKASTNEIGEALGDLLSSVFNSDNSGYQGIHKLHFGNTLGEAYHFRSFNDKAVQGFKAALEERQNRQVGTKNFKEFKDYKSINTLRKQSSFTRKSRVNERSRRVSSSFYNLNENAEKTFGVSKEKKSKSSTTSSSSSSPKKGSRIGVKKRNYQKKGPKPKKDKKVEGNLGIEYVLPYWAD